jgi:enoyl-CoA hydratase/carnithine racemase
VPDALAHAGAVAAALAARSPHALAHIKHLVRKARALPPELAAGAERTLFCDLMVQPDSLERLAAMNRGERDITED